MNYNICNIYLDKVLNWTHCCPSIFTTLGTASSYPTARSFVLPFLPLAPASSWTSLKHWHQSWGSMDSSNTRVDWMALPCRSRRSCGLDLSVVGSEVLLLYHLILYRRYRPRTLSILNYLKVALLKEFTPLLARKRSYDWKPPACRFHAIARKSQRFHLLWQVHSL